MNRPAYTWTTTIVLASAVAALSGCGSTRPTAYVGGELQADGRIAILPLANSREVPDASDRVIPILAAELSGQRKLDIVDQGIVEEVLAHEPWLLMDRIPPDLVDRFGSEMGAGALLVGSIIAYGYRDDHEESVPEFSLTLRLLESPGGRCLWTAVHSRYGTDSEGLFGIGRIGNLEALVNKTVKEVVKTLPGQSSGIDTAVGPTEKEELR